MSSSGRKNKEYVPPCLQDLRGLPLKVLEAYTGEDQHRLSVLVLLQYLATHAIKMTLSSDQAIAVLMGVPAFEQSHIELVQYARSKSADPKERWFFQSKGSTLYPLMKANIADTDTNSFNYKARYFYLNELLKLITAAFTDATMRELEADFQALLTKRKVKTKLHFEWQTKAQLLESLNKLAPVIQKKSAEILYEIQFGVPFERLYSRLQTVEERYYQKSKTKYFSDPNSVKRKRPLHFNRFINATYQKAQADVNPGSAANHLKKSFKEIFRGLIVLNCLKIKKEYPFLGSEERSALLVELLASIDKKKMSEIDYQTRIDWLRALSTHLKAVISDQAYLDSILKAVVENSKEKIDIQTLAAEIKECQKDVEVILVEEQEKLKRPERVKVAIATGVSYSIQYGAGPQARKLARKGVITGAGIVLTALSGPAAPIVGTMCGVGGWVASGITDNLLDNASVRSTDHALERIGNNVGAVIANVVTYPFIGDPSKKRREELDLDPNEDLELCRFVNATLESPTVSEAEKVRTRNYFSLKPGEKLVPSVDLNPKSKEEIKRQNELKLFGHKQSQQPAAHEQTDDYVPSEPQATMFAGGLSAMVSDEEYVRPPSPGRSSP